MLERLDRAMCAATIIVVALVPVAAAGQAPAEPAGASPDVVMTHAGGLLRGAIIESTPGEQVTITLVNGETRRIDWADVRYAGLAEDAPRRSEGAEPLEDEAGELVLVRFAPKRPELVGITRWCGLGTG